MTALLADFDLSRLTAEPWWKLALYGLLLVGGFVAGYAVTAIVLRGVTLIVVRLSATALFRLKLMGGTDGAIASMFLGFGGGFGFGPGAGGAPSEGGSLAEHAPSSSSAQNRAAMSLTDQQKPGHTDPGVLRVLLLGERTKPPGRAPDGFFALPDDPSPQAVNLDTVMQRILELKKQGRLKEVELVISRDPPSVLLEHPVVSEEGGLRERVLKEAQVHFVQPDPDQPTSGQTIRYNPAGGP